MKNKIKNKSNKKSLYGKSNYNEDLVRGAKIFVAVVLLVAIIYFATAILTGEIKFNNKKKNDAPQEAVIQYDEIVAGQSFTRPEQSYYVLYYNFTDSNATKYLSLRNSYSAKDKALSVYMVDLEKIFNLSIVKSKDEKIIDKPNNIKQLKVDGPTLLKFSNKKVVQRITGKEDIEKYFDSITK